MIYFFFAESFVLCGFQGIGSFLPGCQMYEPKLVVEIPSLPFNGCRVWTEALFFFFSSFAGFMTGVFFLCVSLAKVYKCY